MVSTAKRVEKPRIGIFGIGLAAYWPQFASLQGRLTGYLHLIEERLGQWGEVVSGGLVDTDEAARACAVSTRRQPSASIRCAARVRLRPCPARCPLPRSCWGCPRSPTSTGSNCARSCRRRSRKRAVRRPIIAWWWKVCCGSCAAARPGANCLSASGRGPLCPAAISGGAKRASGPASCRSCYQPRWCSFLPLDPCKWDCSIRGCTKRLLRPNAIDELLGPIRLFRQLVEGVFVQLYL